MLVRVSSITMHAAVLLEGRRELEVVNDVEVAAPAAGQVLVRVANCGLCHSDLSIIESDAPGPLPLVLGHEAAGTVEAVGAGVSTLVPGDRVVLAALAPCGRCYWCVRGEYTVCEQALKFTSGYLPDGSTALSRGGAPVHRGLGVGGFGQYVITTETGAVKIPPETPLDVACIIGCAVLTGVGAVLNTAKVEPGATVLVTGLGGIGIAIVQGARLAGAARIVASDPVAERREAALSFGATDVLDPSTDDVVSACHRLTGVGVDYAFEAAGRVELIEAGLQATRVGGTTIAVGVPPFDQALTIAPAVMHVVLEKKFLGCLYGSGNPHREIPRIVAFWRRGMIDLEGMISSRRPLAEINAGFDDMRNGSGIRTVLAL